MKSHRIVVSLLACVVFASGFASHGCGGGSSGARPRPGEGSGGGGSGGGGGSSADAFVVADGGGLLPTAPADVTVAVDTAATRQTLAGFGAAVAYMTNYLSGRTDDIYQVLFVDSGLDILRLGNWYQNKMKNRTDATVNTEFSDYDAQRIVQKATAARGGNPPRIMMSSWSPPSYLKSNGETRPASGSGSGGASGGTLSKVNGAYDYAGFADWWVRSLVAYGAQGVTPDYVSIQNEPDYFNAGWETCFLAATEGGLLQGMAAAGYGQALDAVFRAVAASPLPKKPVFLGPEIVGIGGSGVQRYLAGLNPAQLGGLAHHLYTGGASDESEPAPDSFGTSMANVAKVAGDKGLPLFMTEYSPPAPTLINTAWLMHNALVVENVVAYIYWDLIWSSSSLAPLVTIASANPTSSYTINRHFYAFKHFAHWTDPGWVRVEASSTMPGVKASAFVSPDGAKLTVVLINTEEVDHVAAVQPGAFAFSTVAAYRTSGEAERAGVALPGADGGIALPAKSIATFTFAR